MPDFASCICCLVWLYWVFIKWMAHLCTLGNNRKSHQIFASAGYPVLGNIWKYLPWHILCTNSLQINWNNRNIIILCLFNCFIYNSSESPKFITGVKSMLLIVYYKMRNILVMKRFYFINFLLHENVKLHVWRKWFLTRTWNG